MMPSLLRVIPACWFLALAAMLAGTTSAGDWLRFRGPNGSGVSVDSKPIASEFSETKNLKWKAELPGPGSSCPIIAGDRVFLTCWTGYAAGGDTGSLETLERLLVCVDRTTGKIAWKAAVKAELPEDNYRGMFAENGYASHTPVSDGERVYAFYGKSGLHAYDLEGKLLWSKMVGSGLDDRNWGSASSPIVYKDLVIVTAAPESHTIYAFDGKSGKEVWKQKADSLTSMWGTPVLVDLPNGRTDLVMAVPYEFWGMNPATGELVWYCEALQTNSMCSSVVAHDGIVYASESGPGGGGSIAIRAGGKGDVSKTHVVWKSSNGSRIGTPVVLNDKLISVSGGVVSAQDIKTGERKFQSRLASGSAPAADSGNSGGNRPPRGGPGGGAPGGGRRGGGGRGDQDYSSPVVAGDSLIFARRSGEIVVGKVHDTFEKLSSNRFGTDGGDFSSSPAIADGQVFIRSSRFLYCVDAAQ